MWYLILQETGHQVTLTIAAIVDYGNTLDTLILASKKVSHF